MISNPQHQEDAPGCNRFPALVRFEIVDGLQPRHDSFQRLLAIEEGRTAGDITRDLPRNSVVFASHYGDARNIYAVYGLTKLCQHNRLELSTRFLSFCHLDGHDKARPFIPPY